MVVHGRVQGVGFRYSAVRAARRLHIHGWVRNLSGGDVEIVAEGAENSVSEFVKWVRKGPPGARVTGVDASAIEYRGAFDGFDVEY